MQKYLLIVAAGDGKRLDAAQPKQFLDLLGRPLLMHTLEAFKFLEAECILVLPEKYIEAWESMCAAHDFHFRHRVVPGGPERYHSVKSGLRAVPENCLVAIHDGVRPMVSNTTILEAFDMAALKGNAVPAVPFAESVRETDGALNRVIDRKRLKIIQTPQVFQSGLIKKAYLQPYREQFTDDATVLESAGHQIHLTQGNPENIKITGRADLLLAELILSRSGNATG